METKKANLFLFPFFVRSQAFETKNGNKKSFSFFVKHFLSMSQAFFVSKSILLHKRQIMLILN